MSFFGKNLQNPLLHIKRESKPITKPTTKPAPATRPPPPSTSQTPRKTLSRPASTSQVKPSPSTKSRETLHPLKRKRPIITPRQSSTPFGDSSSDDDDDVDIKRSRSTSAIPRSADAEDSVDFKRRLRPQTQETDGGGGIPSVIHAADVARLDLDKFEPALKASRDDDLKVRLYYPGAPQPER